MAAEASKGRKLPDVFGLRFTQSEVDFVIPDLACDLPLCIDPFLLYKSRDEGLRALHARLLALFNQGIEYYRNGKRSDLDRLIDFPEVNEIGFGYSEDCIQGRGLGLQMNRLLADVLAHSKGLQERGLKHIEELQLVSIGVGPDRVSDIAANALKAYLIEYTQQQAVLWKLPLTAGLPVGHLFDFDAWEWSDGYFDLPRNPISGYPILLVPRRIVRLLPWINYDDYVGTDFRMFLNPTSAYRLPRYPGMPRQKKMEFSKQEVIRITRERLTPLDQYIARKEQDENQATPALGESQFSAEAEYTMGEDFLARLQALPTGQAAAANYQRLVFEILNYCFQPELTDGQMEVKTYEGTERRDIIFTNEGEVSFWAYTRGEYHSPLVMFEVKNVPALEIEHVNQTASYLGARLGMLGFIATRNAPKENIVRKLYSVYNDTPGIPRKIIVTLADDDLRTLVHLRQEGQNPTKHVQRLYREFRQRVQ